MALVLSIAIVYESLRSRETSSRQTRPTLTVVAIWCTVGLGYGVRAGLGMMVGGLSAMNSLTWIGVSCFIVFGIMFVLLTWVLEAASSCYRKESDGKWYLKAKTVLRPHIGALLRYVPIDLKGQGDNTYSEEEDGSTHAILIKRGRVRTPWNLTLAVSAPLGAALGVGLAHTTPGYLPEAIVIPASLAAAGLLAYCSSQQMRLMVSGIAAVALVGATSPFGHWPFNLLAAGPWLAIALTYLMFRGSSYRDLKEFGPNLLRAISSIGAVFKLSPNLLHVVIGDNTWLAAGFESGRKASKASNVAVATKQAISRTVTPVNSSGPDPNTQSNHPRSDDRSAG